MGYNLAIGEFNGVSCPEDRGFHIGASFPKGKEVPADAPLDSSGIGGSRDCSISPSYTGWANFCERVGLYGVFYGTGHRFRGIGSDWQGLSGDHHDPLLRGHPRANPLTEDHYDVFKAAYDTHGKCPFDDSMREDDIPPSAWDTRRLRWLMFWTRWALDNCEYPTFGNT